jgi:hypothetical protein
MNDLRVILEILRRRKVAVGMLALGVAFAFWLPSCFRTALYAVSFSPQHEYRLEYHQPSLYARWFHPGMKNAGIVRLYATHGEFTSASIFLGEKKVANLVKAYQNPLWHQDVHGRIMTGEAVFDVPVERERSKSPRPLSVPNEEASQMLDYCINWQCNPVSPDWITTPQAAPEISSASARTQCAVEGETLHINGTCDFAAPKATCDWENQTEKTARVCEIESLLAHDQAYYTWLSQRLDCAALKANLAHSTGRLTRDLAHLYVAKSCAESSH